MTDKELIARYADAFGHLDFKPNEVLSVEDMVSSFVFSEDEAERAFILLSGDAKS